MNTDTNTPVCWLCHYSNDEVTTKIHETVIQHIHVMNTDSMARQCEEVIRLAIQERSGDAVEAVAGASYDDIKQHIETHMLHPHVTLAVALRELFKINKVVQKRLYASDGDGDVTVDNTQVKTYLSVMSQITSIYKIGEDSKLLFMGPRSNENG